MNATKQNDKYVSIKYGDIMNVVIYLNDFMITK